MLVFAMLAVDDVETYITVVDEDELPLYWLSTYVQVLQL